VLNKQYNNLSLTNIVKKEGGLVKITPERLLREIRLLGEGEIAEYRLLRRLDISHGQFCQLRKLLVREECLLVTHPRRRAYYTVLKNESKGKMAA